MTSLDSDFRGAGKVSSSRGNKVHRRRTDSGMTSVWEGGVDTSTLTEVEVDFRIDSARPHLT